MSKTDSDGDVYQEKEGIILLTVSFLCDLLKNILLAEVMKVFTIVSCCGKVYGFILRVKK